MAHNIQKQVLKLTVCTQNRRNSQRYVDPALPKTNTFILDYEFHDCSTGRQLPSAKLKTQKLKTQFRISEPSSTQTQNPKLKTQNSKLETRNSKLKTQNPKPKTQNSKLKNSKLKLKTQLSFAQPWIGYN